MPKFVELWVYLSATPLFGLTATLVIYVLAQTAYARLNQAPWANPVLWTVLVLATGLLLSGVPTPLTLRGRSLSTFYSGLRWWRWLGRCGNGVLNCVSVGAGCCWQH